MAICNLFMLLLHHICHLYITTGGKYIILLRNNIKYYEITQNNITNDRERRRQIA